MPDLQESLQKQKKGLWIMAGTAALAGLIAAMALIKVTPYTLYTSAEKRIAIKYPSYWQVVEGPEGGALVVFIAPAENAMDVFRENLNITLVDVPARIQTPDKFSAEIIKQVTGTFEDNIKILESKKYTLAGRPGYLLMYVGQTKETDNPTQFLHAWTLDGTRAFILTFTARKMDFKKYHGQVKAMMRSFQMIPAR